MKRVLVTGATGFVGRHALPALTARGFEVHAVSSRPGRSDASAHWHEADLLGSGDADRVMKAVRPTHLLHLAWFVTPGAFWRAPENVDWVGASLRLLRAFATHGEGARRAALAGTSAEYDWSGGTCHETRTPLRPATLYGSAKHGLHVVADAFAREAGLRLAWGRLFFLYGPYEAPGRLVSSLASSLLRGVRVPCSLGEQRRDFLHAGDAGDAFAALLDSAVDGAVNIASGEAVPVHDVISAVAARAGGAHLLDWGGHPVSPGEAPTVVADVARLRDEVGWQPRWSLREGLDATVDWWRGQSGTGTGERAAT